MSIIDIRTCDKEDIDSIQFAESGEDVYELRKYSYSVQIEDEETTLSIGSKEDAKNLIKALQKAIELNWWK